MYVFFKIQTIQQLFLDLSMFFNAIFSWRLKLQGRDETMWIAFFVMFTFLCLSVLFDHVPVTFV